MKFKFFKTADQELGTVFYRHESGYLDILQLPLEDESAVMYDKVTGNVLKAWPWKYSLLKNFSGTGSIESCKALLVYDRDFILDIFNQLKEGDKPNSDTQRKRVLSRVANKAIQKHVDESPGIGWNRFLTYSGLTAVILAVALGLAAVF